MACMWVYIGRSPSRCDVGAATCWSSDVEIFGLRADPPVADLYLAALSAGRGRRTTCNTTLTMTDV